MIYGILIGGLGNQLFIVAATMAHALDMKTRCVFSNRTNDQMRGAIARESYTQSVLKWLPRASLPRDTPVYRQPNFRFTLIPRLSPLVLSGYFQSWRYFWPHRARILDRIRLGFTEDPAVKNMIAVTKNNWKTHTAVHIRRTDYLKHAAVHGPLTSSYYRRALGKLGDFKQLLVFSDSIDEVRKLGWFGVGAKFVLSSVPDYVQLWMFSRCGNKVLANSSFSWWAAMLGDPKARVVAPARWFGPSGPRDTQDLCPKNWLRAE